MRKTALPLASIALALLASGVGLLHAVEPAEATFAGQNGIEQGLEVVRHDVETIERIS